MILSPPVYFLALLLVALTVCGPSYALAYDLWTHRLLSERAYTASPAVQEYARAVGLAKTDAFDAARATPLRLLGGFHNTGTPLGWLIEGSIREDDYHTNISFSGCEPPSNPPSAINRVQHHFFDHKNGRGLSLFGVSLGLPAPAWALGEQGRGTAADENQFSLLDARLYQLRSLVEATPSERERYTALMFRSLGQVIHLLEDMAQPQHTRNDVHPLCENILSGSIVLPEHSWYETYIEQRARGRAFRGRPTQPLQIAPYPAAGFLTFELYFSNTQGKGLADFSSRNFLSPGTNLGGVSPCGGRDQPPCTPGAYRRVNVPHSVATIRGATLTAPVTLFILAMADPISGAALPDVAVTSRSLWDQHLENRGEHPAYSMNVLNYDSISAVLLPRATGYAAGVLDDFFRGQLDASVQPAGGEDPAVLKLVARNASDDTVDGVLLVYAEDAISRDRRNVFTSAAGAQPLGAVPTGVVLSNELFPEIQFRPPFETEKYVVVYHGKRLGPTRVEDPPVGAIGAVMAQVLGGPRAEAIVPQEERRLLRAVDGTFQLPEAANGLALIQWSDLDNHFVGIAGTPLVTGAPAPDEVKLFRLDRPRGSVEVPLISGSDPPTVAATLVKTAPFPYGLDLGTTVDYTQRVRVQQPLVTYTRTLTLAWVEENDVGAYKVVADAVGAASLEVPVDETVTFAQRFPIVLDRDHLFAVTAATPRPYFWRVLEVGQDLRERLLAVVSVQLTQPPDAERSVVMRTRSGDCSALEPRGAFHVDGFFPAGGLIAVIDVERGEVLGTTSKPLFAPSSTELASVFPYLQQRTDATFIGGPSAGKETRCTDHGFLEEDTESPRQVTGAVTLPPTGMTAFAVPGFYRSDVYAAASTPVQITQFAGEFELVYAFERGPDGQSGVNKIVTVASSSSAVTGYLTQIREGARMRPGSRNATEVLLRFDRPEGIGDFRSVLVRWDPTLPSGTRLALPGELEGGLYTLKYVTPDAALLRVVDIFGDEPRTVLVNFNTQAVHTFAGDISGQFVLLPPEGLYNLADTHFHTHDTLAETALPLALAPGPAAAPPVGAYHLIVRE